ncbi:MAG TPA: hypothetical protein V6D28_19815 [Leptolyngbyaceae cyanobacterium]
MMLIRDIVEQALTTGYLTVEAEDILRKLLKTKYESEDLTAFLKLQEAAVSGIVRQQSRELFYSKEVVGEPIEPKYRLLVHQ